MMHDACISNHIKVWLVGGLHVFTSIVLTVHIALILLIRVVGPLLII